MSKFNETKKKAMPTEVNYMDEMAYAMKPEMDLALTVLTTFVENGYYENQTELMTRIKSLVNLCDPYFVAQLAIYARHKANMRSVSHVLATLLATRVSGTDYARKFYDMLVVRPDDISETLAFYFKENGEKTAIANAMKYGFKSALESLSDYQIAKYKMENKDIKLVDLANLLHPKAKAKNLSALMKGEKVVADTWETKLSDSGKKADSEEELTDLKADAWESQLMGEYGMPYFALLRNLRNIITQAPSLVDEVCKQLTTKNKVLKSRLLPFRFIQAYSVIEELTEGDISEAKVAFKNKGFTSVKTKILDAIETAMNYSIENLPTIKGKLAILSDNSGSMGGDYHNPSLTSAMSKVTTANIANLFATMMYMKSEENFVGLFGDRLVSVDNLVEKDGLAKNFKKLSAEAGKCGGSTEEGIYDFFKDLVKNETKLDMVVVFSDCQIGSGNRWYGRKPGTNQGEFQDLFKQFRKINPQAIVISVNLHNYGTTVFDEGVYKIGGWSDKVIELVEKLSIDKNAMINEIKKMDIKNWKREEKEVVKN